ncbi:DNA-binding transcriptional LysR family regulator [Pseudomonas sp. TE6349]
MEFQQEYPDIRLALDFSDRTVNLAEEGIDLSIRITSHLDPILIVRKLAGIPIRVDRQDHASAESLRQ